MNRRTILPLALGALLLGGVPALADADGSTEQRTVTRSCGADMSDNHFSTPQGSDCRRADGSYDPAASYTATEYTNDVRCGEGLAPANPTGVRVYAAGDPATQNGRVGTCSEGGSLPVPAPVQGRAGVQGGTSSGVKATVDGDKDNAAPNGNETARGWATAQVGPAPGAPVVTCGDEFSQGGRADSDAPQSRDAQGECQG